MDLSVGSRITLSNNKTYIILYKIDYNKSKYIYTCSTEKLDEYYIFEANIINEKQMIRLETNKSIVDNITEKILGKVIDIYNSQNT